MMSPAPLSVAAGKFLSGLQHARLLKCDLWRNAGKRAQVALEAPSAPCSGFRAGNFPGVPWLGHDRQLRQRVSALVSNS